MRESYIFYISFYEAIKELPPEIQLEVYNALSEYALFGSEPELTGISKAVFLLIKPTLDKPVQSLRNCGKYQQWRMAVFDRDNHTCQKCKRTDYPLHAHHKERFCKRPDLIFEVDNGITLCEKCHREVHKR